MWGVGCRQCGVSALWGGAGRGVGSVGCRQCGVGQGGFMRIFCGMIGWLVNPPLQVLGLAAPCLTLPLFPSSCSLLPTPYSLLPTPYSLICFNYLPSEKTCIILEKCVRSKLKTESAWSGNTVTRPSAFCFLKFLILDSGSDFRFPYNRTAFKHKYRQNNS